MDNKSKASYALGVLIFIALLPLSFHANEQGFTFLINSPYAGVIWIGFGLAGLVLGPLGNDLSADKLLAVAILYSIFPLTVYGSESRGLQFIFLAQHIEFAIAYWALASLAWGRYFFSFKANKTDVLI